MTMEMDTIVCSDALDLLRSLDAGSVDAVITDPPYGIGLDEWDKPIDIPAFLTEAYRVLKTDGWLAFTTQAPIDLDWRLALRDTKFRYRHHVAWVKNQAVTTALALNKRHEELFIYSKGKPDYHKTKDEYFAVRREEYTMRLLKLDAMERIVSDLRSKLKGNATTDTNGRIRHSAHKHLGARGDRSAEYVGYTDVWVFAPENVENKTSGDHQHASKKPLKMFVRLVELLTPSGAIIVDPFAGTGTTARACQLTGRHFIAGDLRADFVDIAKRRLALPFTTPMFD